MIYDCFTFFNELDVLEIRLNELNGVVDKFVLVEATLNHQGKEKPLFFNENKERFKEFLPKIIHVIVREYPSNPSGNSWVLEHHQRNAIMDGIKWASPEDVIMISDVDEIPRPEVVMREAEGEGIRIFRLRMFYYYMNCMNATYIPGAITSYYWNGTVMVNRKDIKTLQPFRELSMKLLTWHHLKWTNRIIWRLIWSLKLALRGTRVRFVADAGWHFSYLGGVDRIITKLEAFAHAEFNKPEFKDPVAIGKAIKEGRDIFGRGFNYKFVPLDDSFPEWFMENKEKYPSLFIS